MIGYYLIIGVFALLGFVMSSRLKNKFKTYSMVPTSSGLSGGEIAQKMLRDYGIHDVQVTAGQGFLSDHYNPATKTVTLSPDVYHGRHVAAAAVAAHECGHAVQHNTAYAWLNFRSNLVPVVNFANMAQQWLFIFALGGFASTGNSFFMMLFIGALALTTLFSLVTLPVEFDASKRALVWLDKSQVAASDQEYYGAKDALKWAAMTYIVAAVGALVTLLFFLLRFMGSSND